MTKKVKPTPTSIATAVGMGRAAVEAFVAGLDKADVLPFLAHAMPLKKDFDQGVKLAEMRVIAEGLVKTRTYTDDDGAEHEVGEWIGPHGVIYVWQGAKGDPECGDPVGLRSALEMEDIDKKVLDNTIFQVWKVDFANLKRIEAEAVRLTRSGDVGQKARGERIVGLIKDFRGRKKDGPPHLKEKE